MARYTRIICTLGPASSSEEMISKMASRGMNVARINCSHGTHKQYQKFIDTVRAVNQKHGYKVQILLDLEGYRLRLANLKKNITIDMNETVYMAKEEDAEKDTIPFEYDDDIKNIKKGQQVFIDDGRLHLKVMGHSGKRIKLKVLQGGVLKPNKGINIPALKLQSNIMTEKDREDLEFGLSNKVSKIAQSFVRNRKDIQRVVEIVKARDPQCKVIAKIESAEGVQNIESIVNACDGVMVARGDLGVTIPLYKVPLIQKYIISHCNRKKKLSITATQMLESMITEGRPTRAEVSDVANAILDGSDYVMLSGETAVGKYPSRTIQTMSQIVEYTEKFDSRRPR
ncbi:MAG: pyruvate kinase [Candidatus Omnitrophica bacterium]|nr:pyruvate kinase [Candidatus Omnitrophota bacterium]